MRERQQKSGTLIESDELDDRHLGVVALPGHGVQHSAVAAVAVAVPFRARLEEGVHQLLVVHVSQRLQVRKGNTTGS